MSERLTDFNKAKNRESWNHAGNWAKPNPLSDEEKAALDHAFVCGADWALKWLDDRDICRMKKEIAKIETDC